MVDALPPRGVNIPGETGNMSVVLLCTIGLLGSLYNTLTLRQEVYDKHLLLSVLTLIDVYSSTG
jgi:hypothetical protein